MSPATPLFYESDSFCVFDIRQGIAKHKGPGYPFGWRGRGSKITEVITRKITSVTEVVNHQTYGGLAPGEKGPHNTFAFEVAPPKLKCLGCGSIRLGTPEHVLCGQCGSKVFKRIGGGRGFPTGSYHVYCPWKPDVYNGKAVVYLCYDLSLRTWHTTGANQHGVAIAWQGMFYSRHLGKSFSPWPQTDGQPSDWQKKLFMPVNQWVHSQLGLSELNIKGHFDYSKPACPGDYFEELIRHNRGQNVAFSPHSASTSADDLIVWTSRQQWLWTLGYDLGNTGPAKNGVDGAPGDLTRNAIRNFQKEHGLVADGLWGPETERIATLAGWLKP